MSFWKRLFGAKPSPVAKPPEEPAPPPAAAASGSGDENRPRTKMSDELFHLVVYGMNQAIGQIINTDGPLGSFLVIEDEGGNRAQNEFGGVTTDQDIEEAIALGGVQRYAFLNTGNLKSAAGPVPILMANAGERGDPNAFVVGRRFVAGRSPRFSELAEQNLEIFQLTESLFREAKEPRVLSETPEVHEKDENGATPLHRAAFNGQIPRDRSPFQGTGYPNRYLSLEILKLCPLKLRHASSVFPKSFPRRMLPP